MFIRFEIVLASVVSSLLGFCCITQAEEISFGQFLGANVHLGHQWNELSRLTNQGKDVDRLLQMLKYVGINTLRDQFPTLDSTESSILLMREIDNLSDNGIRFDFGISPSLDIAAQVKRISQFATAHPKSIEALEGANEVVGTELEIGLDGTSKAERVQRAFWEEIKRQYVLYGIPVINYSIHDDVLISSNQAVTPLYANAFNIHCYDGANELSTSIQSKLNLYNGIYGKSPYYITEAGYYTGPDMRAWGSVSEEVQAEYISSAIFDAIRLGARRMYLYELIDNNFDTGSTYDPENHYGLFRADGTPKISAKVIQSISQILTRTTDTLHSVSGDSEVHISIKSTALNNISTMTFKTERGSYLIAIWPTQLIWDRATLTEITRVKTSIKVSPVSKVVSASVFDPFLGSASILTVSHPENIELEVGNHIKFILLEN